MTTINPNVLAQTPDRMDTLVTQLESLVRPDDKKAELHERIEYLKNEVSGSHYTPEEALEGLKMVAGDYIANTFVVPVYNERIAQVTSRDGSEPDADAKIEIYTEIESMYYGRINGRISDYITPDPVESQGDTDEKVSFVERAKSWRPIKALRDAKAAYAVKAKAMRELNSYNKDDPSYDVDAYTAAKEFAEDKTKEYKTARRRAIGGTALAGAVVGLVTTATDKLAIPFENGTSWQEAKNMAAVGAAGGLLGAASLWREKRKISEDQRQSLLEKKNAEIDQYEESKPAGYSFEGDEEYDKLFAELDQFRTSGWKERFSTKWAEWNVYSATKVTTGAMSGLSFVSKAFKKLQGDGFTKTERRLDWSQVVDEDVLQGKRDLENRLDTLKQNTPEEEWATNPNIQSAIQELDQFDADATQELGEDKRILSKRGKVAIGVGLLAGAAALYVNKYGFDLNPFNNGGGSRSGNTITDQAPTGSGNKTGATETATTVPSSGGENGSGGVTEHLTPKRQGIYDQLDSGSQEQIDSLMTSGSNQNKSAANTILDASGTISKRPNSPVGSTNFNRQVIEAFEYAAKLEEIEKAKELAEAANS